MSSYTATADDHRTSDDPTVEVPMGNLHLNDLLLGSWGASWQPDTSADRTWLDIEEPHPPDEEHRGASRAWDGRPIFERLDAYGEDVQRLRRLIIGS